MKIFSPAKINLALGVTGKDPEDGYHYIESVFDPISLFDVIEIAPCTGKRIIINDVLKKTGVKTKDNIIYKAIKLFFDETGIKAGINVKVYKHIPCGAGMGGGSSNAAAVLKSLNTMFKTGFSRKQLAFLGGRLGSDVPFFIYSKPALVTGKGGNISFIKRKKRFWYCVVQNRVRISTKKAYNWLDQEMMLTMPASYTKLVLRYMQQSEKLQGKKKILYNVFEKPVFERYKSLAELKKFLKGFNCIDALMSGSGSALYAVFEEKKEAEICFNGVRAKYPKSFAAVAQSF